MHIPPRAWIIPILAAIVLIACGVHARADDKPQLDCAAIRYYVAEHGKAAALAWAIRSGYSFAEINAARRCLKEAFK